ncbi:hypothetical protein [Nocardia arthritidis]|uniref:DUF4239 domain-containing protein n=1 Tax=Nocardia arthritidis TaxID=228602 RepID=A0A6G9YKI8_9NOCA|nr:hypothetical protein [Nocardia arthritidis]QIS13670.1 hypothetical protein F5544_29125 [Nocardia arthritidis]
MRTKQRADPACGRRAMLAELGIADGQRRTPGDQSGYSCRCAECVAAQWDVRRLKYWLVGRLLAYGAEAAEVDQRVGPLPVDIYWRMGERQYAIEVRTAPLDRGAAQEHTARLRAQGLDGVLWLCPPGYWVDHLPALGLADFAPSGVDYRVERGIVDVEYTSVVSPRREPYELREFIQQWMSGEMVWGYRDLMTGGWATVTDWEHHTRTQSAVIARQQQELVNQRTALALSRKSVRDKQKQLIKLTTRLERAEQTVEEQAESLDEVRRKLADHHRVDNALRSTIRSMQTTIGHWQLVTVCAMLLIVTFVAGAMFVR